MAIILKVCFPTDIKSIEERIRSIDPELYGKSRNYIDGAVTLLSPYIARGFISTKQVFDDILSQGRKPYLISKFVQELAWRDYFQQVWKTKRDNLAFDLKQPQPLVRHHQLPKAVLKESLATGINGIDQELVDFYEHGYLHNHIRMYLSSIICNVGGAHWKMPSQWMYYHLLDADFASNTCSWQWVAGTFSSKKYIANQENINRYLKTEERGTYLDQTYEEIAQFISIPKPLEELVIWDMDLAFQNTKNWFYEKVKYEISREIKTQFTDNASELDLNPNLPTLLYDFYNLDPKWHQGEELNRIFLMRPSYYKEYPVSPKTMDFIFSLSHHIPKIKFFWGEWEDIYKSEKEWKEPFYWKEHPTNNCFIGFEEPRDWIFPEVQGYFPSFFNYWKKCETYWLRREDGLQPTLPDL